MKRAVFGLLLAAASTMAAAQDGTASPSLPSPSPLPPSQPRGELQAFAAAYGILQESLPHRPDDRALVASAIQGLVQGTDPESEYFTPAAYEKYMAPPLPDAGAMGIELRTHNARPVLAPIEDGPAAQAGIRFGDQLVAVDGTHTQGLEPHEVLQLFKGAQGTPAALTIFRESDLTVRTLSVERRAFPIAGPKLSRPLPSVAMLRIPAFRDPTLQDTVALLRAEWARKPFTAFILDLRGCPGGLIDASIGVASMFLPADAVVATFSGRRPDSTQVFHASKSDYAGGAAADPLAALPGEVRTLPLAVLVDEGTTAGAEMVAAALKDHRRATLIGRTSFGKASIQTVTPLDNGGAIKYTTAYWTSPSGSRVQGVGVAPDMVVTARDPEAAVQTAAAALLDRKAP